MPSKSLIAIIILIIIAGILGGCLVQSCNRKQMPPKFRPTTHYTGANDSIFLRELDPLPPLAKPRPVTPEQTITSITPDQKLREKVEKSTIPTVAKVEPLKKKSWWRSKPADLLVTTERIQPNGIKVQQQTVVMQQATFQIDSSGVTVDKKSQNRAKFQNTVKDTSKGTLLIGTIVLVIMALLKVI